MAKGKRAKPDNKGKNKKTAKRGTSKTEQEVPQRGKKSGGRKPVEASSKKKTKASAPRAGKKKPARELEVDVEEVTELEAEDAAEETTPAKKASKKKADKKAPKKKAGKKAAAKQAPEPDEDELEDEELEDDDLDEDVEEEPKATKKAGKKADKKGGKKADKKAGKKAAAAKPEKKAFKRGRGKPEHTAATADKYELYQKAVQVPEADLEFFETTFKELRKRKPLTLREDFCGTAYLAATWVQSDPKRHAIGVDLDPEPLAWGEENVLSELDEDELERLELHEANVLDGVGDKTDIVCAMNFSYNTFRERSVLKDYFQVVYDHLEDDGVFFTELYGGTEAIIEIEEDRDVDGFTYIWEQETFNPLTNETRCHIHFTFPDGTELRPAFSYDWRLWTITELRDLLHEVGFSKIHVYWETVDEDGDGTGEFERTEVAEQQESWLVYIVALK